MTGDRDPNSKDAPGARCAICDVVEADVRLISTCLDCGRPFHLNPYSNREGTDCGDAVLGENLGLYFFCNLCLDERNRAAMPAGTDPALARAEAMIAAIHGDSLGFPVRAPAAEPPARSPAKPARARRRYRRIDLDR